jgi:hypothetical protein
MKNPPVGIKSSATPISRSPATAARARRSAISSRVFGVGPQIGVIFPVGEMQGYLNVKGYKEFEAEHRPEGWNLWVTFAVSPEPPKPAAPARRSPPPCDKCRFCAVSPFPSLRVSCGIALRSPVNGQARFFSVKFDADRNSASFSAFS